MLFASVNMLLFVSVNMLEPIPESSSGSWCFLSVKGKTIIDNDKGRCENILANENTHTMCLWWFFL